MNRYVFLIYTIICMYYILKISTFVNFKFPTITNKNYKWPYTNQNYFFEELLLRDFQYLLISI